jgi:hypothetical protein
LAGRDITEGRATRAIAVDIGVVSSTSVWQNTDVAYNVAIGGIPFIYAINDSRPYIRQTAPFRKDQFDNGAEPGEQSLTGWWLRSQMSFHSGAGIKFFDPATTDENGHYRFAESEGVDVWTKGQATLLRNCSIAGYGAAGLDANGKAPTHIETIKWTISGTKYNGSILAGDFNIVRVAAGPITQPLFALSGTQDKIYAATNDGENVYFVVNEVSGSLKMHVYKKSLSAALSDPATLMFNDSVVASEVTMAYVKERIVLAVNNKIYELSTSATALPTPVYTHPNTSHIWTAVAASGTAIYVSGRNGLMSSIVKFTLNSSGVMPTLTSAITAAEMPAGELVYSMYYYLGFLMIGTSKGVRAAAISDTDGSITYGPLIVETLQPVYDFAARQNYIWCASGTTTGKQGLIRIDLTNELEQLRFAYANDLNISSPIDGGQTVAVGFLGDSDRLLWGNCSSAGRVTTSITYKQLTSNVATLTTSAPHNYVVGQAVYVTGVGSPFDSASLFPVGSQKVITAVPTATTFSYAVTNTDIALTAVSPAGTAFSAGTIVVEAASDKVPSGYIKTGNIRYGTLEPKNFKRLLARGDFSKGSMTLETVDKDGVEYDHIAYDATVAPIEVTTSSPATAQEYVAYKFILNRDSTTTSTGPIFKGYQAKATIATPRQRIIQFPVYCFDTEEDKYNVMIGYEGRAFDKLRVLEDLEAGGDVVTWQDLDTKESRQAVIEEIKFTRLTPPDKRFDGYGGVVLITIRTV